MTVYVGNLVVVAGALGLYTIEAFCGYLKFAEEIGLQTVVFLFSHVV